MLRWCPVGQTTVLELFAPKVPGAAGTFVVYGPGGGEVQASATATYSALSTTLGAAASPGTRTLTVTSTTGFAAGRQYLLGTGDESTGAEWVTVARVVDGTTLSLVRPVRVSRASGTALASTRVTFSVTGTNIETPGRNYHLTWTWASGGETQPPLTLAFDVTRYSPLSAATLETVRAIDPLASKHVAEGTWIADTLAHAWGMLLARIAAKVPPGGLVGAIDLSIPHAYLTLVLLLESGSGDDTAARLVDRYEKRFTQELEARLAAAKFDDNQDGKQDPDSEFGWSRRSIQLVRV